MKAVIHVYEMKKIIKATKEFLSKDDLRPALQNIRLDLDKETMKLKATAIDGFMMSVEYAPLLDIDESFTVYIKPYLPVGIEYEYMDICLENDFCQLIAGDRSVGYKQSEIKWLDTDKLLKDMSSGDVVAGIYFDNEKLATVLKSFGRFDKTNPAVIEFRGVNTPILVKKGESVRMLQVCRSK